MGEIRATARGHSAGNSTRVEQIEQLHCPRHRPQLRVEQRHEDLAGLSGQHLDRVGEAVPLDHDLQAHLLRPTHHRIEQVGLERVAPPPQQLRAHVLVKLFCVDKQTIEVEGNGLDAG